MADTFPGQHQDETIDIVFRQHPIVMRRGMLYGLIIFAAGTIPFMLWPLQQWTWWAALAGFLVGVMIFGYRFIGWFFSVYIVTNERLIQIRQRGFFDRSVQDISHNRIQSVQYEVKVLQSTLFKFGTIAVQTFAGPVIYMTYIHKPEEVHQHLNSIIRTVTPVGSLEQDQPEDTGSEGSSDE
jgi:uncharacterized membrane protein YdbT with pleckstrin-like domain